MKINKGNIPVYLAMFFLFLLIIVGVFAPLLAPYDPYYIDIGKKLALPDSTHLLGTDHLGRDILSRLIYGTRLSLLLSLIITILVLIIGIPVGILVGWYSEKLDDVFTFIMNILMSFPSFILSMALIGILGQGLGNIIISIVIIEWIYYARILRNMVLDVKNQEYILAVKTMGASDKYILTKYVLPVVIKPLLIIALVNIGNVILTISGFSFLGIGVQPNIAEWGMMLSDAKPYFRRIPGLVMYPGLAIFFCVLTFNIIGEYFESKGIKREWEN